VNNFWGYDSSNILFVRPHVLKHTFRWCSRSFHGMQLKGVPVRNSRARAVNPELQETPVHEEVNANKYKKCSFACTIDCMLCLPTRE
jgi:hypothetical protein